MKERLHVKLYKTNPKCFWKYVNSRLKAKPAITCLCKPDDSSIIVIPKMAEILNSYFTSAFTTENLTSLPSFVLDQPTCLLENIDITSFIAFNRLVNIKPGNNLVQRDGP